ncbi:MAG: CotH kinase family protein, partial [Mogibacterium sp.]|nr:CotH kinase family protein [Mogibacterium sp.]
MNTSKKRNNGILRRISVILLCFFVFMVTVVPTTMTAFAVAGDGSEADEEQVEMATEETQEEPAADETVEPAEPAPEEADAGEPEEPAEQVEAAEEEPEDEVTVTDEEPEPAGGDVAEEPVVKAADDGGLRATAPTKLWVAPSDTNNIPVQIDVFVSSTKTQQTTTTYTCELYFPGNANLSGCQLSWDGGLDATVGTTTRSSGSCPIPDVGSTTTYTFTSGRNTYKYTITTYQGSASVVPIFIDIDETFKEEGETTPHTIAAMDGDTTHEKYCVGQIYINGTQYELSKIKGRGNATWIESKDKKPYNITLGNKIKFPGIDSEKTKKWSLLAENLDHSLLGNRIGYHLAHEMGIGQDTASADVWMNGEYQGCYTVTPKTDSFVTKNGFMIEQDNYLEGIENGGDPQFKLDGMREANGWSSCYNRITVKKIGDNLLLKNGVVDDSDENLDAVSQGTIKPWLQDAWDAIRSDTGYNSKGKYYTDYIDIESFAKMYLMHEYVKSYDVCAGSIYFHRDGMTDDDKLFAGPLWDLDNAMGSVYQNGSLGNADDRSHGDRRRGDQAFISQLPNPSTIYKTSIYQTISKHDDFMEEVYKQYNKYHSQFDNLPDDLDQMISDVDASARMNHRKVTDLGNGTGKNNHYYASQTTLGTGQYQQTYLATTNSKTDWGNYAANLKTYVRVRSLWFHNTYRCTHTTLVKTEATAPTCTEPGNSAYWTCSTCGEYFSDANGETEIAADSWVIPATGHSLTAHPAVAATCTTAGNSAYWSCSTCGKYFSDANGTTEIAANSWVIAATGHGWGTPTYTWADDNSTVTATRVCGNDASHKETETVAATGVVTTAAGCETKGVRTYTSASFANAAFTVQTKAVDISPTGHDWNEPTWVWADDYSEATATIVCKNDPSNHIEIVKDTNPFTSSAEPTCTEGSAAAYVATVVFEGEEYSDVTSKFIPALGHDWSDWTVTQEPTCTATGTKTRTCSRCNETETETIAALGHTLTAHPAVAASCETGGNSAYWSCDRCGKYFSDAEGKTEIAANSWVIQATGHTPEVIPAVAATCTQPGSTEGSKCSVCGEILVAPQEIEALGHDYQDVPNTAVAPTCTTAGKKADRKCSHCGDVITGETIQATGHAPEVIPAVAATCTQPG